jgi:UDPglucose 6-dehydrogenase
MERIGRFTMNIGIAGLGVIGSACKYGFEKLGHKVVFHDPKFHESKFEDILSAEIIYICVPTPSNEDGSCNTSIVRNLVESLMNKNYQGIIAIKSTVEPGTTQLLIDQYFNDKICFVPEFLRERCAFTDFTENHEVLAVGTCNDEVYNKIVKSHGKYPKQFAQLSATEAEMLKYYSNVFNALRIIFANEMYEICKVLGADYTKIKHTFVMRGTAKDIYMDVNESFRGYGGVCLPKDTKAIDALVKKYGLDLKLFETIDKENDKFITTVFEGMRK